MTTEDEKKLLLLLDEASKLGFAEVVIRFQDGKAVSADITKKTKLR